MGYYYPGKGTEVEYTYDVKKILKSVPMQEFIDRTKEVSDFCSILYESQCKNVNLKTTIIRNLNTILKTYCTKLIRFPNINIPDPNDDRFKYKQYNKKLIVLSPTNGLGTLYKEGYWGTTRTNESERGEFFMLINILLDNIDLTDKEIKFKKNLVDVITRLQKVKPTINLLNDDTATEIRPRLITTMNLLFMDRFDKINEKVRITVTGNKTIEIYDLTSDGYINNEQLDISTDKFTDYIQFYLNRDEMMRTLKLMQLQIQHEEEGLKKIDNVIKDEFFEILEGMALLDK